MAQIKIQIKNLEPNANQKKRAWMNHLPQELLLSSIETELCM